MAKPIRDNPTLYGKAAKQFEKMFLSKCVPDPEKAEQRKKDIETYRTARVD